MKYPKSLKPGDRIRILSPSGPIQAERLTYGISVLQEWGLEVEVDPNCYSRTRYLAGSDNDRLTSLQNAIDDPEIKAVFFSRGGYGLSRIVSDINFRRLITSPKWFVGFSDISAFLLSLFEAGIGGGIHGPVVASFGSQRDDIPALRELLFENLINDIHAKNRRDLGLVEGPLWGGNLSLVVAELATGEVTIPENAVLFLEDVGEADYRLDRLLTVLSRAAKGKNIAALLFGTFNDCSGVYVNEAGMENYLNEIALETAERLDCTLLTDVPFGHLSKNISLPMGAFARICGDTISIELK